MRSLGAGLLIALLASSLARALPDPNGRGRFPVGVTTLTFTKTSVTTGQPRPLATVIWYPAVPGSGTATALGQRDAEALRRRFPLVVFSHGSCGIPTQSTFLTIALAPVGSADIRIPTMLQGADADTFAPFASNDVPEYARLAGPRFLLEILHTGHFAWVDVCAAPIFHTTDCGPGTNTIGQDEAHGLVLRFAVPFVERYVAGDRRWGRLLKPAGAPPGVVLQAEARH